MRLSMSVFGAVDIATLAGNLDQTHFLAAVPALVRIGLNSHTMVIISFIFRQKPSLILADRMTCFI